MALSLIVFDCDGVLLESVSVKSRAFYLVSLEFGEEAADRLLMFHEMHGGVNRYEKFAWLYKECLGRDITEAEKAKLNDKFTQYALEELGRCGAVPGARETLEYWKGRVPMYVASGAPHEELCQLLQQHGMTDYFDGIHGAPPGKTALLRNIVEAVGALPSETVMIGDSSTDMYAAEAVHTLFYGRGEYFKHSAYPWHTDLTQLNRYLEELAAE